jgi:hypothetical protein
MTCGKPHNAHKERDSSAWGSWADPEDGHVYRPMSAAEIVKRYELVPK